MLVFGEEIAIEKERVLDILASGAGNYGVLNAKREKFLQEDFSAQFSSALIYRDLYYCRIWPKAGIGSYSLVLS